MKSLNRLHQLIQRLGRSDLFLVKSHFENNRSNGKDELEMLEFIRERGSISSKEVKSRYGKVFKSNPTKVIVEIYNAVLDAVSIFNLEETSTGTYTRLHVDLLVSKKLYEQAAHKMIRVIPVLDLKEDFPNGKALLETLESLVANGLFSTAFFSEGFSLRDQLISFVERQANLDSYIKLHQESFVYEQLKQEDDRNDFLHSFESHSLLTSEDRCKSQRALLLFHRIKYRLCLFRNDFGQAAIHADNSIEIYRTGSFLLEDVAARGHFISSLLFSGICHLEAGNYAISEQREKELDAMVSEHGKPDVEILERLTVLRLHAHGKRKRNALEAQLSNIEQLLFAGQGHTTSDYTVMVACHCAIYYLNADKPEKAIRLLSKLRLLDPLPGKVVFKKLSLLLFLAGHIQNGNFDTANREQASIAKEVSQFAQIGIYEAYVLEGLSLLGSSAKANLATQIEKSQKVFAQLSKANLSWEDQNLFDWESWLKQISQKFR